MNIEYADIAVLVDAGKTPTEIVTELTANPPAHWFRTLSSREALDWLGGGGRLVRMKEAAVDPENGQDLMSAMQATLIVIERPDVALDLSPNSQHWQLLMGCVGKGVFYGDDVQALIDSTRLVATPTEADITACIQAHADDVRRDDLLARRGRIADAMLTASDNLDSIEDAWAAVQAAWGAT